ncbi:hypothetical protein D3C71_79840 [compost metagenome]
MTAKKPTMTLAGGGALPPIDHRTMWTIRLPEVAVKSLNAPFTITARKENSINEFMQKWMDIFKLYQQPVEVTVVPEHMAAWTQLQWYAEFGRVVSELNSAQAETPSNWKKVRLALEQWELFAEIARAAGHEITVNYDDPTELVDVVPSVFSYHFTGPLGERTIEDRFALILQAICDQHGGSSVVPGYTAAPPSHDELDRLVGEYQLKGDLSRWIIHTTKEDNGNPQA